MRRPDPSDAEAGFTLIEVLVAFVVAALTAGQRGKAAEERIQAIRLVSQLVRERGAQPWSTEERKGERNGLLWSSSENIVRNDPRGFFALTRIEAHVSDRSGRPLFAGATQRLRSVAAP
jgi:prepilin-type N-terminal cleavage/methylation domain-containing protein